MNNVLNKNGKKLEETLACSSSGAVKKTSRDLCNFKMTLSVLQVLKKPLSIPLTFLHALESITNGSVGQGVTFKLVGCQFKLPGHLGRLSDPICYMKVHMTCNSRNNAVITIGGEDFLLPVAIVCHATSK